MTDVPVKDDNRKENTTGKITEAAISKNADGKLVATKKQRGSMEKCVMKAVEHFLSDEPKEHDHLNLIWGAGLDQSIQDKVTKRCKEAGFKDICWIQTGGVIGSHSGPGAFGIVAMAPQA